MKPAAATFRNVFCFLGLLALSVVLAACGGGGGGTSSNPSGSASVSVSLAAAPGFPAGTTFATSMAKPSEPPTSSNFDNVWVTVNKIALIPVDSIPISERNKPDQNGELEVEGSPGDGNGFVTVTLSPSLTIDLQNAPDPLEAAQLLTMFKNVPVGEYSKIRVYYDNVTGDPGNVLFHPTAHYHFDVHFVGGNLVIPMGTSEQGIQFYSILINVVGLKIHQAGASGKFLMRPQVFATVGTVQYVVSGIADNVVSGKFDIVQEDPEVLPVHVIYGDTTVWSFWDSVEGRGVDNVSTRNGTAALRESTKVKAIGTFSGENLLAREIIISFEDVLRGIVASGDATSGWTPDNTVVLDLSPDNVVVPRPTRAYAVYDNADVSSGHETLSDADVAKGATVTARGYFAAGVGIDAFWISVAGP
jgi:hypothetical protein